MSVTPMRVQMQLNNFLWMAGGSGRDGGQVYLWAVFFKIDGDTVSLGQNLQLQGTATVVPMPGNQGDLGTNDFSLNGAELPIPPAIGRYVTVLNGIPVFGMPMAALVGVVAVVMLQCGTPASAIAAGHDALNTTLQQQLNDLIPTFGLSNPPTPASLSEDVQTLQSSVQSAVVQAVTNGLSTWEKVLTLLGFENQDEQLMTAVFLGAQDSSTPSTKTFVNLANVPAQGAPLQQEVQFSSAPYPGSKPVYTVTYQVNGVAMADPYPLSLKRVLTGLGHALPASLRRIMHGSVQNWLATA
jgi:hypothetical protein